MEYTYSFERLNVWQDARGLVKLIYAVTNEFDSEEKYGLTSQIRRASVSVVSNIAEGCSRSSLKEQIRFLEIAYGSAMEVYCQIIIANDLSYVSESDFIKIKQEIYKITNKINALSKSCKCR